MRRPFSERAETSIFRTTSWTLVGRRVDGDVELNIEPGLDLPRINLRSARILDRKILDILRKDRDLRFVAVLARAVAARGRFLVRH